MGPTLSTLTRGLGRLNAARSEPSATVIPRMLSRLQVDRHRGGGVKDCITAPGKAAYLVSVKSGLGKPFPCWESTSAREECRLEAYKKHSKRGTGFYCLEILEIAALRELERDD